MVYTTIIDIAEKELNIPLRKKVFSQTVRKINLANQCNKTFVCRLFGKSRQSYYKAINKEEKDIIKEDIIISIVRKIRKEQPNIGTRKIYHKIKPELEMHSIKIGRDKLFKILNNYNMLVSLKKRRAITTNSYHRFYKYPNLIKEYEPDSPNKLWVSDITYIRTHDKFAYLTMITDAYSKK